MDFDDPVSTRMSSPQWWPAVSLIIDLQNLIRSSVGASEYSLSASSKLFKEFTKYRGNNICSDEWTNECSSLKT